MKRFVTVFAICGGVLTGYSAHAQSDCSWNGATSSRWEIGANWSSCGAGAQGFPAGSNGTVSLVTDRAKIDLCEAGGVLYDLNSGYTTFSTALDSRLVQEILIEGGGTSGQVTALVVSGAVLRTERLVMKGGAANEFAILHVKTTDNAFQPQRIKIASGTANSQIKVEADLTVGEETFITDTLDLEVTAGKVFDMGRLTCVGCTIQPPAAAIADPVTCS